MRTFAELLDRLVYTGSRNAKLKLIGDYLRTSPDPDRGWALAALTGTLDIRAVKPSLVREMIEAHVDPELFSLSRDFVGDTAETCALLWEGKREEPLRLGEVVDRLMSLSRQDAIPVMSEFMDRLDASGRFALIKLATGALRVGVSARLAKTAFAGAFGVGVDEVEELWHGLRPPYAELFAWAEGRGPRPDARGVPVFRPFMLAHPLGDAEVDITEFAAEWKWDGIRVQLVHAGGETRLFSRGGDDITASFPEVAEAFALPAVVDGELLVRGDTQAGAAASFNTLQQRLGRKRVSAKTITDYPAFVKLYDVLFDAAVDLRESAWETRRARLEALVPRLPPERFDLSELVPAQSFEDLVERRNSARDAAIEGLMLKRRDSPYVAGRRVGLWYKWKRDPLTADCVLMYAQRGSGKRSSFYSDFTFGCWTDDGQLLPVGKAYFGFTDDELKWLDKFIRDNTIERFGPVREVDKRLVLEVAFDSIHLSNRHKSGLAMRFPRISRIRSDKPAGEADTLAALRLLVS